MRDHGLNKRFLFEARLLRNDCVISEVFMAAKAPYASGNVSLSSPRSIKANVSTPASNSNRRVPKAPALANPNSRNNRPDQPLAPPATLLSIGGREGAGQRINGDYELMEGERMHSRPCWLRRGRLASVTQPSSTAAVGIYATNGGKELEPPEREVSDDRPLYLFFSEMGYWTIAPSLYATGVQVFARNGPDFGVFSPDEVTGQWVVFANGKHRPDPTVVCFRHAGTHQPPDILHLSGCRGLQSQLNGFYHLADGVAVGSRPVFIQDGLRSGAKNEKKIIHFSQRTGRWLISNATAVPTQKQDGPSMQLSPASGGGSGAYPSFGSESPRIGEDMQGGDALTVEWCGVEIFARSPVAWTSMSPVHLLPREPWAVRKELPHPKIRKGHSELQSHGDEQFEANPDLRVAQWTGSSVPYSPDDITVPVYSPITASRQILGENQVNSPLEAGGQHFAFGVPVNTICIHLMSPQSLSDPYAINGDYVKSGETYAERPVYIKLPLTSREAGNEIVIDGTLVSFYDEMTRRWYVAPEIGEPTTGVARSPVGWDPMKPVIGGLWQLREPTQAAPNDHSTPASFSDSEGLKAFAIHCKSVPRTIMFGGEQLSQALCGHVLSGDFRLIRERYGRRPVYKRMAQPPLGTTTLYLFFEPRSGYWVISSGSPLTTPGVVLDVDVAGLFGGILARSGPAWNRFTPEVTSDWEVFDRQALSPQELLEYQGRAPGNLLTPLLKAAPWLRLHHVGVEAPPRWLCVGGFGQSSKVLNGTYELLPESRWSSRPAWQRIDPDAPDDNSKFVKYIFFWPESGHWLIGPDLHIPDSALSRSIPACWVAETPEQCAGRWSSLNRRVFQEDAHAFVRRQKTANGGALSPGPAGLASPPGSPRSPRRSLTLRAELNGQNAVPALHGRAIEQRAHNNSSIASWRAPSPPSPRLAIGGYRGKDATDKPAARARRM